jgi:hypothetical protein
VSVKPIPLDVPELPEGWTPLSVYAVVKCLDEDGRVGLVTRASDELSTWEAIGMLTGALDSLRSFLQECFDDGEEQP